MDDVLLGWDEIARHLRLHARTAQRYERTQNLPVHRRPGGGPKAPVFALKAELDDWLGADLSRNQTAGTERASTQSAELAAPVLDRILGIARGTKLYRRNYFMRFDLKRSGKGVCAKVEYRYELCNAADQKQAFVQELTVDDADHGYVESMSLRLNGRLAYHIKKPAIAKELVGYALYLGPKQLIPPSSLGATCRCEASWVIHRADKDIWYNHMVLPTVGVQIETHAPSGFDITRSYTVPGLVMKGEHLDIAWRRRP